MEEEEVLFVLRLSTSPRSLTKVVEQHKIQLIENTYINMGFSIVSLMSRSGLFLLIEGITREHHVEGYSD